MTATPQLVWFKRDLRVHDHEPLHRAAAAGPIIPLFIIEPTVIQAADFDALHYDFIRASLTELRKTLADLGQPLIVRRGDAVEVLGRLWEIQRFERIWSHQETGNGITFERDRRVRRWARDNRIEWVECLQHGVFRGLTDRDGWARRRKALMSSPLVPAPESLPAVADLEAGSIPDSSALGLNQGVSADVIRESDLGGGESAGLNTLDSFLTERGARYEQELSSPATAYKSCSRLSPYLAYGCVSMRRVEQAALRRADQLRRERDPDFSPRAVAAFRSRLNWHCHFIQKLESEPEIESANFNRACDGLREPVPDAHLLETWQRGNTGFPFVDACTRALQTHGWLNFRMRAMLVSFAAYHLWLDWRLFKDFLARQFIDYEPGIHFSQLQMQSGTTGINTLRIYNPIKQGYDQDPGGAFVRQWVPELAGVPDSFIHEPWKMPRHLANRSGCVIGQDYPGPVVDHEVAARVARSRFSKLRRTAASRRESRRVLQAHGSRRPARRAQRS